MKLIWFESDPFYFFSFYYSNLIILLSSFIKDSHVKM